MTADEAASAGNQQTQYAASSSEGMSLIRWSRWWRTLAGKRTLAHEASKDFIGRLWKLVVRGSRRFGKIRARRRRAEDLFDSQPKTP
jgi:hypothetical protein